MVKIHNCDIDISITPRNYESIGQFLSHIAEIDNTSFENILVPETWGHNAVSILSLMANQTTNSGIGTGIMPIYSRSPALIGQTVISLQDLCDNQFRLGLGCSSPQIVENWHGYSYERPLRYLREYIDIIRKVVSGHEVNYDGEFFNLSGFNIGTETLENTVKIDVAGQNPKMVELAGRFADGWNATYFTTKGLDKRLDDLKKGMKLGSRDPDAVRVSSQLHCHISSDYEKALEEAREHIAFTVSEYGPYYRKSIANQGYEDTVQKIHTAWKNGDSEYAKKTTDVLLNDGIAAYGTPKHIAESINERAKMNGIDSVVLTIRGKPTLTEKIIDLSNTSNIFSE